MEKVTQYEYFTKLLNRFTRCFPKRTNLSLKYLLVVLEVLYKEAFYLFVTLKSRVSQSSTVPFLILARNAPILSIVRALYLT